MDDKLQWHDFINPLGMASYVFNSGKNLVSGLVNNLTGQTASANAAKALEHAEAREDTAVQRRVEDLKAAGLNPILAASGTGAASSAATAYSSSEASKKISHGELVSSAMKLIATLAS